MIGSFDRQGLAVSRKDLAKEHGLRCPHSSTRGSKSIVVFFQHLHSHLHLNLAHSHHALTLTPIISTKPTRWLMNRICCLVTCLPHPAWHGPSESHHTHHQYRVSWRLVVQLGRLPGSSLHAEVLAWIIWPLLILGDLIWQIQRHRVLTRYTFHILIRIMSQEHIAWWRKLLSSTNTSTAGSSSLV
jgi:hypothetical protein